MASTSLYPPNIENTIPAFIAAGDSAYCRLYFSLSKYSSSTLPIKSIHISVVKQSTGQSVVRKVDSGNRFRSTGILILNMSPIEVKGKSNLYYVDILNSDIQSGDSYGWQKGWIYKIQIRLSTVEYDSSIGQSAWLNINANNFSEWSTYCVTKSTAKPRIIIPVMKNFDSDVDLNNANKEKEYTVSFSTLNFTGTYENEDLSETLYSYRVQLFEDDEMIEDSGPLYSNQYYNVNQFEYLFRYELQNLHRYFVHFSFETINQYEDYYDFTIEINNLPYTDTIINAVTIDTVNNIEDEDFKENLKKMTSLELEQEEGRIGIKLYANSSNPFNGNICLRRADSRDNFSYWTDIKIIPCINTPVNNLDMIFDYTVESGVWYKYGVQVIDTSGNRSFMNVMNSSILREWEYSYLLGEKGRQLKLKYNNSMDNYSYTFMDSKTDTIGGKYPFINRNGNTKYRTFPINGLISFNMDENKLFTSDKELYTYQDVISAYQERRQEENLEYYDYKREYDFREKVLEFLQDGKPKLFKSSTEGNIIVRLMQVTSQPNQSLNRMIYSFTSTAYEIDEASMENYLKYGFYEVGDYVTSFERHFLKLGQLEMDFKIGDNIIQKIWEKYDHSTQNLAGTRQTLKAVHHLSLEFGDLPLRVYNSGLEEVLGNNFRYNNNIFTVRADFSRKYVFDDKIVFSKGSDITVLGGIDDIYDRNGNLINTVHVLVDFLYETDEGVYEDKRIDSRTTTSGIGQFYNTCKPGVSIYKDIYYKYYYDWGKEFRNLVQLSWTCLEANPGAVFLVQDSVDDKTSPASTMYHEMNLTGTLNFENLGNIRDIKYIGIRKPDGTIDTTKNIDVIVDYTYITVEGTYLEE